MAQTVNRPMPRTERRKAFESAFLAGYLYASGRAHLPADELADVHRQTDDAWNKRQAMRSPLMRDLDQ